MDTPTQPRKQPRQARSRATVDTLLEATAQVLTTHGYRRATTGRIAERAGVSIGSLYQYFPNRDALVAALVERHCDRIIARMQAALDGADDLEAGVLALIRAGQDTQRIDPALHKVLVEQIPRVGRFEEVMDTHRRLAALIEVFLQRYSARLAPDRTPALAATLVESTLEAAIHRAVHDHPALLDDPRFTSELFALVIGYLTGQPPD